MADRYWVGGTGTWDASVSPTTTPSWATTSGGSPTGVSSPTAADNAIFDANSGATAFTVTQTTGAVCLGLTIGGLSAAMTFTRSATLQVSGSVSWPATNLSFTGTGAMQFVNGGTKTFDPAGVTTTFSISVVVSGGSLTLTGPLVMSSGRTLTYTSGNFNAGGFDVTAGSVASTGAATRTFTLGAGTWTLLDASTSWNLAGATNLTLVSTGSTILMSAATAKTFAGNGYTYGVVKNAGAGQLTITGANTFGELGNTTQPCTIVLPASTTTTVTTFSLQGTAGNLVSIISSTVGTAATLSKASGTVTASYLSIKDSTATGGATWDASNGTNTNVSGNTGWVFTSGTTYNLVGSGSGSSSGLGDLSRQYNLVGSGSGSSSGAGSISKIGTYQIAGAAFGSSSGSATFSGSSVITGGGGPYVLFLRRRRT